MMNLAPVIKACGFEVQVFDPNLFVALAQFIAGQIDADTFIAICAAIHPSIVAGAQQMVAACAAVAA